MSQMTLSDYDYTLVLAEAVRQSYQYRQTYTMMISSTIPNLAVS
jgi:hypothetical protein